MQYIRLVKNEVGPIKCILPSFLLFNFARKTFGDLAVLIGRDFETTGLSEIVACGGNLTRHYV
jgi:hypothetical protein